MLFTILQHPAILLLVVFGVALPLAAFGVAKFRGFKGWAKFAALAVSPVVLLSVLQIIVSR